MEFLEHRMDKPIVKVGNLSNLEQMTRNGGIQKNLKSKTQSADSSLRPRCEGSGKGKDLPTLAPHVEGRNETRNPLVGEEEYGKVYGLYLVVRNLRPRCEGSGKGKDLPTLAPRIEVRNETRNPPLGERGGRSVEILKIPIDELTYTGSRYV
ncbi:hypothetical protein AVEN_108319-1 [Araneus ventricosus]|uniref:Uncharacterized protein n=1 Tax=Araneus ventricosus TaxID=182803 RepID=A0A4Y2M7U0_ARAVE|nr:hypothetical protein AVEN_108319-1 [Araneus ventricosus]